MSTSSKTGKLKEDVSLNYPEITSPDIFETTAPFVSISDEESSIAFATEFKWDSPIPTKKAKVCSNLFGDDHPSESSFFDETLLTRSYKLRNSTPIDPLKCSAFQSESLGNILSDTYHHDGQELERTQVTINEDECKKEKSSFQSKHFSLYVADPFTNDNPENLKYPLSPSNIPRGWIPKIQLDLPYFEQEDEKQMDANYFKCNTGENFKCTKTDTVEFPDLSSLDKSLDNETDNSSSSNTSVFESQVTDINDNLESIKEEFDLDSINSDDLIDWDCDNIYDELSILLKDDFPCKEGNGAPSTHLNNTLKNYADLLPEINTNIKPHSIFLDSFKDWTKNQQDNIELVHLNDITETEKSENCCSTNVKPFTDEFHAVSISQNNISNKKKFYTQVNIKDKLEPTQKETSNMLSTGINLAQLMKDLYDIEKNIAQAVLVSIAKLDKKAGARQSQILKYIHKSKIVGLNPKLHLEVSRFLTTACEVGLVKKKAFKYMLTDQVRAIADKHKRGEQKIKPPGRIRNLQIDTIKKLSTPINSPKLLRSTKANLKLGIPKLMPKVFKTLRSRVVYHQ